MRKIQSVTGTGSALSIEDFDNVAVYNIREKELATFRLLKRNEMVI